MRYSFRLTNPVCYFGTEILAQKKMAFKKSLFVPYHVPLKFGLSAKSTALPDPMLETIKEAEPFMFFPCYFWIYNRQYEVLLNTAQLMNIGFLICLKKRCCFYKQELICLCNRKQEGELDPSLHLK